MNKINRIIQYFDQTHSDWNIIDFLEDNKEEPFRILIDSYLRYLKHIIQSEHESKKEKAQLLVDKYKEDTRPDYHLAKSWRQLQKFNNMRETPNTEINIQSIWYGNEIQGDATISNQGNANNVQNSIGKRNSDSYDDGSTETDISCSENKKPAYWGILDLTKESLKNSGIKDMDIQKLSQDFSNKIEWKDITALKEVQEYFDGNCVDIYNIDVIKKLDRNMQFMVDKLPKLRKTCTEEELKMSTTFPLFSGIFNSPNINNSWGEIQAISTNKVRNEEQNPFTKTRIGHKVDMKGTLIKTLNKFEIIYGEVSGGLTSFSLSASYEQRKKLIVYSWLQVGVELSFYAIDWIGCGIYRFGKIDKCELSVDEDDLSILEDAYCILRLLKLESEKIIKEILQNNTKNKRRCIMSESDPYLNKNRTPIK
ncbi:17058_t:CDS:2 [Funneliformis caledonium]|uniref:17058_t:CDS:1 n=1 Tax=Funneliformis caledonium TaxID=1117310 RepID=A0A9N9DLF2_9GLOM|nr:17058_t:CDS:2 [Funneliformis caledonium]